MTDISSFAAMKKKFCIGKKGRKYFECTLAGKTRNYRAKLVINDVSRDFQPDAEVEVLVNDISTRSAYGASLIFEPTSAQAVADATAAERQRQREEKWLEYAEHDAATGDVSSNAIEITLRDCKWPAYAERVAALKARLERNRAERQAHRPSESVVRQPARTTVPAPEVRTAMFLGGHPQLGVPMQWQNPLGQSKKESFIVVYLSARDHRIEEDDPSIYGHQLLGYEGDWCSLCEYRKATPEEVAAAA